MGNICSRSRNETDNFNQPGRVVGTNPPNAAPRASVPAKTNWKTTPGRTLGERESDGTNAGADEARANAAIAAQKRAEGSGPKGKLGSKLAAQKAQTHSQTLGDVSRDERAARDADGAAEARRWE